MLGSLRVVFDLTVSSSFEYRKRLGGLLSISGSDRALLQGAALRQAQVQGMVASTELWYQTWLKHFGLELVGVIVWFSSWSWNGTCLLDSRLVRAKRVESRHSKTGYE